MSGSAESPKKRSRAAGPSAKSQLLEWVLSNLREALDRKGISEEQRGTLKVILSGMKTADAVALSNILRELAK